MLVQIATEENKCRKQIRTGIHTYEGFCDELPAAMMTSVLLTR